MCARVFSVWPKLQTTLQHSDTAAHGVPIPLQYSPAQKEQFQIRQAKIMRMVKVARRATAMRLLAKLEDLATRKPRDTVRVAHVRTCTRVPVFVWRVSSSVVWPSPKIII